LSASDASFYEYHEDYLDYTRMICIESGVATREEVRTPLVANVTSHLVTFIRMLQNLWLKYA